MTERPEHLRGPEYNGWDAVYAPADVEFIERDGDGGMAAWQDIVISGKRVGSLEARPAYCDRGRWMFKCDLPDLDGADSFPRYYMNIVTARWEIIMFLNWRLWRRHVS